jgi:hypothetical protein
MKTRIAIFIFFSFLLCSCIPETPTQEDKVIELATESPAAEEAIVQEPIITEVPAVTELPTEALTEIPTETPVTCVTLLTPVNEVHIPPVGKVTFSWTALDAAGKYVLKIILPSGEIVPFETDQTFHDRYMEAFVAGGEYQWQVSARGMDGSEICISETATFEKPASQQSRGGNGGGNGGIGGQPSLPPTRPPPIDEG